MNRHAAAFLLLHGDFRLTERRRGMRLNENITKLEQNYLFAEIAMRVR